MNEFDASSVTDEELALLRATAQQVARHIYAPKAAAWDQACTPLPSEERKRLADLGFLGICLPESCGGAARPLVNALVVIEELAKECMPAAFCVFEANTGPARVIELFGTDEQRQKFLPSVVRGDSTIAVAISEPDAGSAATDLQTTATVEGDEVVVNGSKRWCSGAGDAEQYLVYVRFDGQAGAAGIGAVVVDRDAPGITFGPREHLMGFRSIPSADIRFESVRIPAANLVVSAGGFRQLFSAFSIERLGNATMSLAIAQTCLDRATAHVRSRKQFGRELMRFQAVQLQLADMVMRVHAARLLINDAASHAGLAVPSPLASSVAKCFANETAKYVADAAMQLHGGYGYAEEVGIERYHRDAVGWALAGGTPTIQRLRIASEFLGERFDQRR